MAARLLRNAGSDYGLSHRPLDDGLVEMMTAAAQVPDARREADPVEQAWLARRHGIRWVDEVSLPV